MRLNRDGAEMLLTQTPSVRWQCCVPSTEQRKRPAAAALLVCDPPRTYTSAGVPREQGRARWLRGLSWSASPLACGGLSLRIRAWMATIRANMRDACSFRSGSKHLVSSPLLPVAGAAQGRHGGNRRGGAHLQAETHALRVRAQTHRGPVTVEFVTCATCASRCRHPAAVAKATLRSTLSSDGLTLTYNTLVRASI